MDLYTIGYEGCSIEEFVSFLKIKGIQGIADVRKNPVSRKKGFSKRRMAEFLAEAGIAYEHFPGLGVPTEWRKQAKNEEITRAKMFRDYEKKILPQETESLKKIAGLASDGKWALLCYEADASDCHRRRVSDAIVEREKRKVHVIDLELHPAEETDVMVEDDPRLPSSFRFRKPAAPRRTKVAEKEALKRAARSEAPRKAVRKKRDPEPSQDL